MKCHVPRFVLFAALPISVVLAACGGGGGGTSSPAALTCTTPQVLSIDGKSCVTPTVAIVSATDAVGVSQGTLANGAATNDTQPKINGILANTLSAGQTIVVLQDGVQLGTVMPAPTGTTWQYTLPAALVNNATFRLTAKVLDGTGTLVDKASEAFDLTVVTTANTTAQSNGALVPAAYIKISNDGKALPATATLGAAATDWACTLAYNPAADTYLLWEVKTTDGGLRDWNKPYSNYDDTTAAQFLTSNGVGYIASNPSQTDIDASTNSVGFKNAVNAAGLCGRKDWRLPVLSELEGIQLGSVGSVSSPIIDTAWFPNTYGSIYWTSSILPPASTCAMAVRFHLLGSRCIGRLSSDSFYGNHYVRLVRSN